MNYSFQIKSEEAYKDVYRKSIENPEQFWEDIAGHFHWRKKWDKVLEWDFKKPDIAWFKGGKLNITENCLDRHLATLGHQPAIIWEPNDPAEKNKIINYKDLYEKVNQFSQVLVNNGVQKGDRVCIYMGMIPELVIAILACARIGAIHSVVFGGFSAKSIRDRVEDANIQFIITADGANRGNKKIGLKAIVDEAVQQIDAIKKIIVAAHTHTAVTMKEGRDIWWHDEISKIPHTDFEATAMDSEDPLFILYTSGSTGKPKGVVHTCAGYMIYTTYSFVNVFQYQPRDVFFCTADIGWVTGHSYIIYGPLCAGATMVMFEGIPTYPDEGRFWHIVDKYNVNILYTAPTAIRSLMSYGLEEVNKYKLDSLKILGSVGEPINEEAWHWYKKHIGKGKCPIVDTWWQTETGGIMISSLAGITPEHPTKATLPLPGIQPAIMDEKGNEIMTAEASGNLCIKFPWPGMLRTTWGNHERCREVYFSAYPDKYFTGDGAVRDADGNYKITGRVDDVLNVSGHRIGTAEVENALDMHELVIESAVVGFPHDIKGQGIYAFVITEKEITDEDATIKEIHEVINHHIGAIAKPDKIQFVKGLPKTRSGKIMRRILRKIAEGAKNDLGDTTTLLDPEVVSDIVEKAK